MVNWIAYKAVLPCYAMCDAARRFPAISWPQKKQIHTIDDIKQNIVDLATKIEKCIILGTNNLKIILHNIMSTLHTLPLYVVIGNCIMIIVKFAEINHQDHSYYVMCQIQEPISTLLRDRTHPWRCNLHQKCKFYIGISKYGFKFFKSEYKIRIPGNYIQFYSHSKTEFLTNWYHNAKCMHNSVVKYLILFRDSPQSRVS